MSGRRLTFALAAVLVAVAILGVSAAYAVGRVQKSGESVVGSGQVDSTAQPPTSPSTSSSQGGQSGSGGPGSNSGQPPPTGAVPLDVRLSAKAESSPDAQEVHDLIFRYFTAINNHDYDAWLTTVSTAQAKQDRDQWEASYASTHDSEVYISDIDAADDMTVRMQFVSHQSVDLAPAALPLPCVRWDVTYHIIDEGPGLRVGNSAQPPAMAPCT